MTLSTSATDTTLRRMKKEAVIGLALGIFCILFTVIYERFSHGAFSVHMRWMCLFPLLGCGAVGCLAALTPLHKHISRWCFNLWNTAIASFTLGCLFRGIVNISGRFTERDVIYMVIGFVFIALSLIAEAVFCFKTRRLA